MIKILAVDDDPDALFVLDHLLGREGFCVRTANGGRAALAALEGDLVDVIVLDVMMPDLDGLQVCAALRQNARTRTVPIILLTASARPETRKAAMALGVSDFATKPLNSHDLLARIRAQVDQRQLANDPDALLRKSN